MLELDDHPVQHLGSYASEPMIYTKNSVAMAVKGVVGQEGGALGQYGGVLAL